MKSNKPETLRSLMYKHIQKRTFKTVPHSILEHAWELLPLCGNCFLIVRAVSFVWELLFNIGRYN